jgi:hypothetical protein
MCLLRRARSETSTVSLPRSAELRKEDLKFHFTGKRTHLALPIEVIEFRKVRAMDFLFLCIINRYRKKNSNGGGFCGLNPSQRVDCARRCRRVNSPCLSGTQCLIRAGFHLIRPSRHYVAGEGSCPHRGALWPGSLPRHMATVCHSLAELSSHPHADHVPDAEKYLCPRSQHVPVLRAQVQPEVFDPGPHHPRVEGWTVLMAQPRGVLREVQSTQGRQVPGRIRHDVATQATSHDSSYQQVLDQADRAGRGSELAQVSLHRIR